MQTETKHSISNKEAQSVNQSFLSRTTVRLIKSPTLLFSGNLPTFGYLNLFQLDIQRHQIPFKYNYDLYIKYHADVIFIAEE